MNSHLLEGRVNILGLSVYLMNSHLIGKTENLMDLIIYLMDPHFIDLTMKNVWVWQYTLWTTPVDVTKNSMELTVYLMNSHLHASRPFPATHFIGRTLCYNFHFAFKHKACSNVVKFVERWQSQNSSVSLLLMWLGARAGACQQILLSVILLHLNAVLLPYFQHLRPTFLLHQKASQTCVYA